MALGWIIMAFSVCRFGVGFVQRRAAGSFAAIWDRRKYLNEADGLANYGQIGVTFR